MTLPGPIFPPSAVTALSCPDPPPLPTLLLLLCQVWQASLWVPACMGKLWRFHQHCCKLLYSTFAIVCANAEHLFHHCTEAIGLGCESHHSEVQFSLVPVSFLNIYFTFNQEIIIIYFAYPFQYNMVIKFIVLKMVFRTCLGLTPFWFFPPYICRIIFNNEFLVYFNHFWQIKA